MSKNKMVLVLVLVCFIVYFNSLWGEFISDDVGAILGAPDTLTQIFTDAFGTNPLPYHLRSVLLHSFCTIIVLYLLSLFFNLTASFWGALIFAVNPIHTEGVSWISGRAYLWSGIAIFLFWHLYYTATINKKINWRNYFICLGISAFFFMNSYIWTIGLLAIMAGIDLVNGKLRWRLWVPFWALFFFKMAISLNSIIFRINSITNLTGKEDFTSNRVVLFIYSVSSALGLTFFPIKLSFYHEPLLTTIPQMFWRGLLVVVLIISLPFLYRKSKALFLGIIFFFVMLSPTFIMGDKPISWLVAERYYYMISILVSLVVAFIYEKLEKKWGFNLIIALCLLTLVYSARTIIRNEDWRTPLRFWEATAISSPKSPRAHNNYGEVLLKEGNTIKAIQEFSTTLKLFPKYSVGWHNLGVAYATLTPDDMTKTIKCYKRALLLDPRQFETLVNLGIIYLNSDMFDEAIKKLEVAVNVRPENKEAQQVLEIAKNLKKNLKKKGVDNGKGKITTAPENTARKVLQKR